MNEVNEPILINQLKQGESKAFSQMVQLYQHLVYNTAYNLVQQAEEAEDVAQEVFIQAYQSIKDFRGDSKLSTWLYRITITKSLDWVRKKQAKKRLSTLKQVFGFENNEDMHLPDFNHPGVVLDNKENALLLFKALNQIPDTQRVAFLLIKAEGLSYEEVSKITNTTIKALEALMHRAKTNLRKILAKSLND